MAAIIWTDVTNLPGASSLSTVSAGYQAAILAYVNGNGINVDRLDGEDGETTKLARTHLAAHMASMARRGVAGGGGQVTQMSEGGVSISYAQPTTAVLADAFSSTPFGVIYSMLVQRSPKARGPVVA